MALNISKTGILKGNQLIEPFISLPDGSKWQLLLFHYVDGGNNLFKSSNCNYCNDFGLFSRLKWIDNFTYGENGYEFYVIQDGIEYRWTQTNQPTASTISGLTAVSGYPDPVNGLAKNTSQAKSYLGYGSWWGACGAYSSYTSSGKTGIPAFGGHNATGICAEYLALYARISEPKAFFESNVAQGAEFYEY